MAAAEAEGTVEAVFLFDKLVFPGQREALNVFEGWSWQLVSPLLDRDDEPGEFFLVHRTEGVGTRVRVLEHQIEGTFGTAQTRPCARLLVLALPDRVRVSDLEKPDAATGGVYRARLVPFADAEAPEMPATDPMCLAARALVTSHIAAMAENSLWRAIYRKCCAPPLDHASRLSFWMCAVLRHYQVSPQKLLNLFLSVDPAARLQGATELFQTTPSLRAVPRRPVRGVCAIRESSSTVSRQMQRWGGLRPAENQTLRTLCADAVFRHLPLEALDPQSLGAEVLQPLVDRHSASGMMTKQVLQVLHGSVGVRALQVIGAEVADDWLLDCIQDGFPFLQHLEFLACSMVSSRAFVDLLAHMPQLVSISFERSKHVDDSVMACIVQHHPMIQELNVSGTGVGLPGLRLIGGHLDHLRALNVCGKLDFDDKCAHLLFGELGHLKGLRVLLASTTRMTADGARLLGALTDLETLSLGLNPRIQDWTFLGSLTRLTDLDLSLNCTVDDNTVEIIGNQLPLLEFLNLEKCEITDACASSLANLVHLYGLDLRRTSVSDGIAVALAPLQKLRVLALAYTGVSSALAPCLAQLPALRTLRLSGCSAFGDSGLAVLANNPRICKSLEALEISGVSNLSTPHFIRLEALQSLQLWESGLRQEHVDEICARTRLVLNDQIKCTKGTWILALPEVNKTS